MPKMIETMERDFSLWPEEMWELWENENDSGIWKIDGVPYEYGPASSKAGEFWLRPEGKDSPVAYSDIRRDDPRYVDGTEQFRSMVEAVRMIQGIRKGKVAVSIGEIGGV